MVRPSVDGSTPTVTSIHPPITRVSAERYGIVPPFASQFIVEQLVVTGPALPASPRLNRAAANVRAPLPHRHDHPDPAGRRRWLRHLPVGRAGSDQPIGPEGSFRGGQGWRR